MHKNQLLSYINHPEKLNRDSPEALGLLKEQYPFCQTIRLLMVKKLYQEGNEAYHKEIADTAAWFTDRRILYEIIHPFGISETLPLPEDPEPERPMEEADVPGVMHETVSEEVDTPVSEDVDAPHETIVLHQSSVQEMPAADDLLLDEEIPVEKVEDAQPDIREKQDLPPSAGPTLRQNIANLLSWQLHELEQVDPSKGDLIPEVTMDISKLYGTGSFSNEKSISAGDDDLLILDEPGTEGETTITAAEPHVFEPTDAHSFNEWLSLLEKPAAADPTPPANTPAPVPDPENKGLIEIFIETNPRLTPPNENTPQVDISEDSVKEHDGIFTDTLARIYIKQGYYSKAIFAYEKLILKYPEKSGYFAAQIDEIKKLTNKK